MVVAPSGVGSNQVTFIQIHADAMRVAISSNVPSRCPHPDRRLTRPIPHHSWSSSFLWFLPTESFCTSCQANLSRTAPSHSTRRAPAPLLPSLTNPKVFHHHRFKKQVQEHLRTPFPILRLIHLAMEPYLCLVDTMCFVLGAACRTFRCARPRIKCRSASREKCGSRHFAAWVFRRCSPQATASMWLVEMVLLDCTLPLPSDSAIGGPCRPIFLIAGVVWVTMLGSCAKSPRTRTERDCFQDVRIPVGVQDLNISLTGSERDCDIFLLDKEERKYVPR